MNRWESGIAKRVVINEAEDGGREGEVLSRITKKGRDETIIGGKISQPACFTYVSYTTNGG